MRDPENLVPMAVLKHCCGLVYASEAAAHVKNSVRSNRPSGTLVTSFEGPGSMLLLSDMPAGRQFDLRNSMRFPLHLQVTLKTADGEYRATTSDISAGGILFQIESEIEPGSRVEFEIEMPIEVSGVQHPASVLCAGRVVRCTGEGSGRSVAVVIDEYRFKRV